MVRSPALVRFKERDEPRYLGPSSGIAITRLVMELAKQYTESKSIKEIVPEMQARQIKDRFSVEEHKPTSKVYPLISDVAAPHLPSRELTARLVEIFYQKAQYMLPTLHEPSFLKVIEDVYCRSTDAYNNFTLRMVIAISMQKLDAQYAGLADSYYLAALPFLETAVKAMDLGTLQCFALIAQYSLVTPTRTAAYWVVGLAAKLCQELGITEEATIAPIKLGKPRYNPLEVDMRRRLFWIITSMEFGLAHSLGRPSAFGTTFEHIDVKFFQPIDDRYITPTGIEREAPPLMKKKIAIHFFKMRLLQAEVRRKLYLKKRLDPEDDSDPWFTGMELKLKEWLFSSPKNDEGSGLSETWFRGRYNTMTIMLHRPSPQVPEPSVSAARKCFEAAVFNIQMQREQIASKSIDLTWIFTQALFMALNTMLWTLSYAKVREEHTKQEVEKYVSLAQDGIDLASQRWPGVEAAKSLYDNLIYACLRAYDSKSDSSVVGNSPSIKTSPASSQDLTPPRYYSPLSDMQSTPSSIYNLSVPRPSPGANVSYQGRQYLQEHSPSPSDHGQSDSYMSDSAHLGLLHNSQMSTNYQSHPFDPGSLYNSFPPGEPMIHHGSTDFPDYESLLGPIGEHYSQYLHTSYNTQQPLAALSEEQQVELMETLETAGLK